MRIKTKSEIVDLKAKLDELMREYARLKAEHENSQRNYSALVGTLLHLHRRLTEDGQDCEPLVHAVAAAKLIKNADIGVPIEEMEKIGLMFFALDKESQIIN